MSDMAPGEPHEIEELRAQLAAAERALAAEQTRAGELEAELEAMRLPVPDTARKVARLGLRVAGSAKRRALEKTGKEFTKYPAWTGGRPTGYPRPPYPQPHVYDHIARVLHGERAELAPVPAGTADGPLRVAVIIPPFGFGSGGHAVLFNLAEAMERRGHAFSFWLHDPFHERAGMTDGALRQAIATDYANVRGPAFASFDAWNGADVVLATGWQTVYRALSLPNARSVAYVVNDHEPEFYATSVESFFAEQTYRLGIPSLLGGGDWLQRQLADRYGVEPVARFPYPVEPEFKPRPIERRDDTIILYGRNTTPRRAVGLALIALEELTRRRPATRVVLFGDWDHPKTSFPYEHFATIEPEPLSWLYSEATIGMAFSMTHGSLVPHDMMACGLPVLDIDGYGTAGEHADSGLVELAPTDPFVMADALERLLDDPQLRASRSAAGLVYAREHTWEDTADAVEAGLRSVLRAREVTPA